MGDKKKKMAIPTNHQTIWANISISFSPALQLFEKNNMVNPQKILIFVIYL